MHSSPAWPNTGWVIIFCGVVATMGAIVPATDAALSRDPSIEEARALLDAKSSAHRRQLLAERDRRTQRATRSQSALLRSAPFPVRLPQGCYTDRRCSEVDRAISIADRCKSLKSFSTVLSKARQVFESTSAAVEGDLRSASTASDEKTDLASRTEAEGVFRAALVQARGPSASLVERCLNSILEALLTAEIERRDAASLAMLSKLAHRTGWGPKPAGGGQPWYFLTVQHADANVADQYRILEQWKPLVAKGEVSEKAYAYLYDRVFLRIGGKQLYGTQFRCVDSRYVPAPMEDEGHADERRRSIGLPALNEYAKTLPPAC